jgi:ABC-2 type transport system permease protein
MFESMLKSIKAEWKRAVSEKTILIVIIIIPILTGLFVGFEFEKGHMTGIPMAVADMDNSATSRMIVQQFRENETFHIKYETDDSDMLKKLMDESKVRVGLILPRGFEKDMKGSKSPTLLMLYDGSHISMSALAKIKATEILLTLRCGAAARMIAANTGNPYADALKLVQLVGYTNRTLYNPTGSFKFFLNPILVTAIVQTGIVLMASVAIRQEELEKKKRKKIGYALGKFFFYGLLGTVILVVNITVQYRFFGIPFRGNYSYAVILSVGFAFSVTAFGLMFSSFMRNKLFCTLINAVLFIPSPLVIGYTWPFISLPKGYRMVTPWLPLYHYADNVRNLFLNTLAKAHFEKDILWFLAFTAAMLCITFASTLITGRKAEAAEEDREKRTNGQTLELEGGIHA